MTVQKIQNQIKISFIFLLIFGLFPLSAQSQIGDYVIEITQLSKAQFPQVEFYVAVKSTQNDPIEGLLEHQFEVLENGIPATLDKFSNTNHEQVTTILVIDKSGSMTRVEKLDRAKDAATAFINDMRDNDQAGIIVFSEQVEILQGLTSDKITLIDTINSIDAEGWTACYDAVIQAISELQPVQGRKTVIVLTDGVDNKSQRTAHDTIAEAQNASIQIQTIGLGKLKTDKQIESVDAATLKRIANQTRGHFFHAPKATDLTALYLSIAKQLKHEYHIIYTSPRAIHDGVKRETTVRINYGGQRYETTTVYNPGGFLGESQSKTPGSLSKFQHHREFFLILLGVLCFIALFPRLFVVSKAILKALWFCITSIRFWNDAYAVMYKECPICRESFNPGGGLLEQIIIKCPACQTVYHRKCWKYIKGKCGAEGCSYSSKQEGSIAMSRKMKIYYCVVLGAIGGLLAWALIESAFANTQGLYTREIVWGAAIGTLIAAFISVAEGLMSESTGQIALGALVGAILGLIGGAVGSPAGEWLFQVSGGGALGRSIGWGLFGTTVGLAEGISVLNFRRAMNGLFGGVIGGILGGLIFEMLSKELTTQASSRAIGFIVLGSAIGFCVAITRIILGQALVIVKKAKKLKGREFTIDSDTTYIGSDWKHGGVFLPKDKQIAPRHAVITRKGKQFYIEDLGKSNVGTIVNGGKIETRTLLADRSEIKIGDAVLEFREKRRGAPLPSQPKGRIV